jgi:hypothetical protein
MKLPEDGPKLNKTNVNNSIGLHLTARIPQTSLPVHSRLMPAHNTAHDGRSQSEADSSGSVQPLSTARSAVVQTRSHSSNSSDKSTCSLIGGVPELRD